VLFTVGYMANIFGYLKVGFYCLVIMVIEVLP